MLKLRNLKRNQAIIESDFYPEDGKQAGHIAVNTTTGEVISKVMPKGYEDTFGYTAHAFRALLKLAENEILPSEYTVMWY